MKGEQGMEEGQKRIKRRKDKGGRRKKGRQEGTEGGNKAKEERRYTREGKRERESRNKKRSYRVDQGELQGRTRVEQG